MTRKKRGRGKHIPQRTCVGCRQVAPKRSMIRIVHGPTGVMIDPTGKLAGRGAYLHPRRTCWERGLHGSLNHALKIELTADDIVRIRGYQETLPEETDEPANQR